MSMPHSSSRSRGMLGLWYGVLGSSILSQGGWLSSSESWGSSHLMWVEFLGADFLRMLCFYPLSFMVHRNSCMFIIKHSSEVKKLQVHASYGQNSYWLSVAARRDSFCIFLVSMVMNLARMGSSRGLPVSSSIELEIRVSTKNRLRGIRATSWTDQQSSSNSLLKSWGDSLFLNWTGVNLAKTVFRYLQYISEMVGSVFRVLFQYFLLLFLLQMVNFSRRVLNAPALIWGKTLALDSSIIRSNMLVLIRLFRLPSKCSLAVLLQKQKLPVQSTRLIPFIFLDQTCWRYRQRSMSWSSFMLVAVRVGFYSFRLDLIEGLPLLDCFDFEIVEFGL